MKTTTIIEEILLVTNGTFFQRQLDEIENTEKVGHLSREEQLEAACWNGLLGELLPEIVEQPGYGRRLFLWQVWHGEASLHLQLSESAMQLDKEYSIDPCIFLTNLLLAN
jgi:hypothetical protein